MELNDDQKKYFDYLQTKFLPSLAAEADPKLKTPAANLAWNAKKFLGEIPGEKIDVQTYVDRSKYDFAVLGELLPANHPGAEFAGQVLVQIEAFFGVKSEPVDMTPILEEKAAALKEKLDWKTSIVDLLKLVDLETSIGARKEYAVRLGFPMEEISNMPNVEFNQWLHGQILNSLACNNGEVPRVLIV